MTTIKPMTRKKEIKDASAEGNSLRKGAPRASEADSGAHAWAPITLVEPASSLSRESEPLDEPVEMEMELPFTD
jgi:hypothetical protein